MGVMLALSALFAVVISAVTFAPDRAVVQAQDPANSVSFSQAKYTASEGDSVTVAIILDFEVAEPVDIPVTVTPGTAEAADYKATEFLDAAAGTAHNIHRGESASSAKIAFVDKDGVEPQEMFTIVLGELPEGYVAGNITSTTLIINDGDNRAPTGKVTFTVKDESGEDVEATGATVGQEVTADVSGISDDDYADDEMLEAEGFTYQWQRVLSKSDLDIEGATSASYTPSVDDVGKELKVKVTWLDKYGNGDNTPDELQEAKLDATAYSEAKPYITVEDLDDNGRIDTDDRLTANVSGLPALEPGQSFMYQWHRHVVRDFEPTDTVVNDPTTDVDESVEGTEIELATGMTYTANKGDIGYTIKVVVTWVGDDPATEEKEDDFGGREVGVNSILIKSENAPSATITISGKAQIGETLTVEVSEMADADATKAGYPEASFYEWRRNQMPIPGASGRDRTKYTLTADDAGAVIDVLVTISDGTGDIDSVASVATLAIPEGVAPGDGVAGSISRIEPAIRSVTLSADDTVTLGVLVYGVQDVEDASLGKGITWSDSDETGAEISYTAPSSPGTYTVTATTATGTCTGDDAACSASIEIRVRRPSAPQPPEEAPVNPPGDIPGILADSAGNQYEVFTPVEGGTFAGEGYSLNVGSGAVPNGEFIGIRMSDEGAASNVGMTHQRYTLGGSMYAVSAVDSSSASISSYVLDDPATVCVPLPDELRTNISDLALVAINSDGSLTILAAQVRIGSAGTMVCGGLSGLPASLAVGSAGAPAPIPTPVPEPTPVAPDTGGTAPASSTVVLWALLLGIAVFALGGALVIGRRRESARIER